MSAALLWIPITLFGSLIINLGLVLHKYSSIQRYNKDVPVYKQKIWVFGTALYILGQVLHGGAFVNLPQSLVASLTQFSLLTNLILAPCILGEVLVFLHFVAAGMVLTATVSAVLAAPEVPSDDTHYDNERIFALIAAWSGILTYSLIVIILAVCIWRRRNLNKAQSKEEDDKEGEESDSQKMSEVVPALGTGMSLVSNTNSKEGQLSDLKKTTSQLRISLKPQTGNSINPSSKLSSLSQSPRHPKRSHVVSQQYAGSTYMIFNELKLSAIQQQQQQPNSKLQLSQLYQQQQQQKYHSEFSPGPIPNPSQKKSRLTMIMANVNSSDRNANGPPGQPQSGLLHQDMITRVTLHSLDSENRETRETGNLHEDTINEHLPTGPNNKQEKIDAQKSKLIRVGDQAVTQTILSTGPNNKHVHSYRDGVKHSMLHNPTLGDEIEAQDYPLHIKPKSIRVTVTVQTQLKNKDNNNSQHLNTTNTSNSNQNDQDLELEVSDVKVSLIEENDNNKTTEVEKPPISLLEFMLPPACLGGLAVTTSKAMLGLLSTSVDEGTLFQELETLTIVLALLLWISAAVFGTSLQILGVYYYGALAALPAYKGMALIGQGLAGILWWQEYRYYAVWQAVVMCVAYILSIGAILVLGKIAKDEDAKKLLEEEEELKEEAIEEVEKEMNREFRIGISK